MHATHLRPPRLSGRPRRGLARADLAAAIGLVSVTTALVLPATARVRGDAMTAKSLDNLRVLGQAHVAYAADHGGRLVQYIRDDMGAWGDNAFVARTTFNAAFPFDHPGIGLGWGETDPGNGILAYYLYRTPNVANYRLTEPIVLSGPNERINGDFGSFRMIASREFNEYVGGRYFDPTYFAPSDAVSLGAIGDRFDAAFEYEALPAGDPNRGRLIPSTYCLSASAMQHPDVFERRRRQADGTLTGGWTEPYSLDHGFVGSGLDQAMYPHLKTLMLEHHWLGATAPDAPGFIEGGIASVSIDGKSIKSWQFNHGLDAAPATLFFDGHVRFLPNTEALAADDQIRRGDPETDGTWSRSTPRDDDGYRNDRSVDGLELAHHVLTADGILGRDTLDPIPGAAPAAAPSPRTPGVLADRLRRALRVDPFGTSTIDPGPHGGP